MQIIHNNRIEFRNARHYEQLEKSIDVEIFEDFESLSGMQQNWDRFMEEMNAEIFLSYDWCKIWWKYYGKDRVLKIFLFKKNDQIVGILPLFREVVGQWPMNISVIKIVGTDFNPITVSIPLKKDLLNELLKSFINELNHVCSWDIIYLGAICGRYEASDQLEQALNEILSSAYYIQRKTTDIQTYFQIANNWEEQIATLSQKQRNKTRREFKEIQKRGLSLACVHATSATFTPMFTDFVQMHKTQWQKRGMPGHFNEWPYSYDFHKEFAYVQLTRGRLRLLQIWLGDVVIGYEYLFRYGNTYQWYLGARTGLENEQHLHFYRLSFREKIESALSENVRCIDAGRGEYEYKIDMGGKLLPVQSIIIYSRSPIAFFVVNLFRRLVWLTDILYSKLWRRRIAPWLGIKTGSFWQWWTKTHMFSH